jgi:hypothetical protein
MRNRATVCCIIMLALAVEARAQLAVDGGTWNLLPNTPGQQISLAISGTGSVTNATAIIQLVGTSSPLPVVTGADIVDGTIFGSNNTGSPSYAFSDSQLGYADVATLSGTVNGDGVLAHFTINTTGVSSGHFAIDLTGTSWGDSYVGTSPATNVTYADGSITIIAPEPTCLSLLGVAALLTLRRRPYFQRQI